MFKLHQYTMETRINLYSMMKIYFKFESTESLLRNLQSKSREKESTICFRKLVFFGKLFFE